MSDARSNVPDRQDRPAKPLVAEGESYADAADRAAREAGLAREEAAAYGFGYMHALLGDPRERVEAIQSPPHLTERARHGWDEAEARRRALVGEPGPRTAEWIRTELLASPLTRAEEDRLRLLAACGPRMLRPGDARLQDLGLVTLYDGESVDLSPVGHAFTFDGRGRFVWPTTDRPEGLEIPAYRGNVGCPTCGTRLESEGALLVCSNDRCASHGRRNVP